MKKSTKTIVTVICLIILAIVAFGWLSGFMAKLKKVSTTEFFALCGVEAITAEQHENILNGTDEKYKSNNYQAQELLGKYYVVDTTKVLLVEKVTQNVYQLKAVFTNEVAANGFNTKEVVCYTSRMDMDNDLLEVLRFHHN